MYQSDLPPWPDAHSAESAGGITVTAEQLIRLGRGDHKTGVHQLRLIIAAEGERNVSAGPFVRPGNVRMATPDDEQAILDVILRDVDENAAHIAAPSVERILAHIRLGTEKRGGFVGVIDGYDGSPAAICVLTCEPWWWSDEWHLREVCNYVHPDHRRSTLFDDILNFERWLADELTTHYGKRVYLISGVMTTHRLRAKIAYYWRRMTEVGRGFIYPSPPGGVS